MASFILNDPIIAIGDTNLTLSSTTVNLSSEVEVKDATTFSPTGTFRRVLGGLCSSAVAVNGFWHAGNDGATPNSYNPDDGIWPNLSTSNVPVSISTGSAVGSIAYFNTAQFVSYQLLGEIGEIAPFVLNANSSSKLIRGVTATDPYTQITATANGASQLLTAVSATQSLYANLHVFAASGTTPSITVKVQSDDNVGFTTSTDRLTFTAATGKTSETKSVAGAITDTYYRAQYTVSGTSPKFYALLTIGIG